MTSALVNVCVDPRLNHELIRSQVETQLERLQLRADRVYVIADVGGNLGSAARGTVELLARRQEDLVLAAVLHHDDCLAAEADIRKPLSASAADLEGLLRRAGVACPVLSGDIHTESNTIRWHDQPAADYEVFKFRMPRMYG